MSTASPMVSQAGGRPILSQQYLQQYSVGTSQKDIIWRGLRDAATYPSAGSTTFTFYSQPIGQGLTSALGGGATNVKTLDDTNMDLSGILGQGNEQYVIGLEFTYLPGIDPSSSTPTLQPGRGFSAAALPGDIVNDLYALGSSGIVTLKVGTNRVYIEDGPLAKFPPANRIAVASAIAAIAATTNATSQSTEVTYGAWSGEPYVIVPLYITGLQKFNLQLNYETAIPTPSTVKGRLMVNARGYYIRQVT